MDKHAIEETVFQLSNLGQVIGTAKTDASQLVPVSCSFIQEWWYLYIA